jgi:hypothetical protein
MTTAQQAIDILLSLPVVQENPNPGYQDFRVRDKIFAKVWSGAALVHLKIGAEEQQMLVRDAKLFSLPKDGGRGGWISVNLGALTEDAFEDVAWKAWRNTAGPKLSLQY